MQHVIAFKIVVVKSEGKTALERTMYRRGDNIKTNPIFDKETNYKVQFYPALVKSRLVGPDILLMYVQVPLMNGNCLTLTPVG
jgi:hypothetical protein